MTRDYTKEGIDSMLLYPVFKAGDIVYLMPKNKSSKSQTFLVVGSCMILEEDNESSYTTKYTTYIDYYVVPVSKNCRGINLKEIETHRASSLLEEVKMKQLIALGIYSVKEYELYWPSEYPQ